MRPKLHHQQQFLQINFMINSYLDPIIQYPLVQIRETQHLSRVMTIYISLLWTTLSTLTMSHITAFTSELTDMWASAPFLAAAYHLFQAFHCLSLPASLSIWSLLRLVIFSTERRKNKMSWIRLYTIYKLITKSGVQIYFCSNPLSSSLMTMFHFTENQTQKIAFKLYSLQHPAVKRTL